MSTAPTILGCSDPSYSAGGVSDPSTSGAANSSTGDDPKKLGYFDDDSEIAAYRLADEWTPTSGVGYEWVYVYAKERYATTLAFFKDLEDKAGSIITYLGSGTGILAIGTIAAVAEDKIARPVVWWAMPMLASAIAALLCALMSRRTVATYLPPRISGALALANHAITEERGKALFAAQINLCVRLMAASLSKKAWWVEASMRAAVAAVALAILPLAAAAVASKTNRDSAPPVQGNVAAIAPVPEPTEKKQEPKARELPTDKASPKT